MTTFAHFYGLDLGTYGTGFSIYKPDVKQHDSYSQWPLKATGYGKTRSAILYSGTTVLHWGNEAVYKYSQMNDMEKKKHGFFEYFKLAFLHNMKGEVSDPISKTTFSISKVMIDFLKCIHEHVSTAISNASTSTARKIRWCVTIPVEYTESHKTLMREFMVRAEMVSSSEAEDVIFAAEPEAAALYAMKNNASFSVQDKESLLIVDAGAGTVDLCMCTKVGDHLEEQGNKTAATTGSRSLDVRFMKFLEQVMTSQCYETLKSKYPTLHCGIMDKWEMKKCVINETSKAITMESPAALFKSVLGPKYNTKVFDDDNYEICLDHAAIKDIFDHIFDSICNLIQFQLAQHATIPKCHLLLVGGLAKNKYLQHCIQVRFGNKFISTSSLDVFADMAICNGASMMAYDPSIMQLPSAGMSYGIANFEMHDEDEHVNDGEMTPKVQWIGDDSFVETIHWVIKKGDTIYPSFSKSILKKKPYPDAPLEVCIYKCAYNDLPSYVHSSKIVKIGSITIVEKCSQVKINMSLEKGALVVRVFNGEKVAQAVVDFYAK